VEPCLERQRRSRVGLAVKGEPHRGTGKRSTGPCCSSLTRTRRAPRTIVLSPHPADAGCSHRRPSASTSHTPWGATRSLPLVPWRPCSHVPRFVSCRGLSTNHSHEPVDGRVGRGKAKRSKGEERASCDSAACRPLHSAENRPGTLTSARVRHERCPPTSSASARARRTRRKEGRRRRNL